MWISDYHIHTYTHADTLYDRYILSFCAPYVCITDWFRDALLVLLKALKLLVFTMWQQRKVLFQMMLTQESICGRDFLLAQNCIVFIPLMPICSLFSSTKTHVYLTLITFAGIIFLSPSKATTSCVLMLETENRKRCVKKKNRTKWTELANDIQMELSTNLLCVVFFYSK